LSSFLGSFFTRKMLGVLWSIFKKYLFWQYPVLLTVQCTASSLRAHCDCTPICVPCPVATSLEFRIAGSWQYSGCRQYGTVPGTYSTDCIHPLCRSSHNMSLLPFTRYSTVLYFAYSIRADHNNVSLLYCTTQQYSTKSLAVRGPCTAPTSLSLADILYFIIICWLFVDI